MTEDTQQNAIALPEQKAFFPPEADPPVVDKIPACPPSCLPSRSICEDWSGVVPTLLEVGTKTEVSNEGGRAAA